MNSSSAIRQLQRVSQQAFRHNHHVPFRISRQFAQQAQRNLHLRPSPPCLLRKRLATPRVANQIRRESTEASQHPLTDRAEAKQENATENAEDLAARKAQEPAYELTFTCRKCLHRSSHRVTKQAYHFGTTLITCPGCKNRHLISDHMKIFSDTSITIEDILREKGQYLRKGRLGEDGDIEFYDEENNEIGQMQAEVEKTKE